MNIALLSATQIVQAIRAKQLTALEVTQYFIDRIQAVNPTINAVCQFKPDQVLAKAQAADDKQKNGETLGPLHGLPITIKNTTQVKGYIFDRATYAFPQTPELEDSTVIQRLKAAGAIILGITNGPEMLVAYESDNAVYGRTHNPYDLTRTPGGSSGGEAAIIAAGGSPLGLGSDAGGSLRQPAHSTGICTIHPTPQRIPIAGQNDQAVIGGLVRHCLSMGPMARYMEDCELMLSVIQGPDAYDALPVDMPLYHSVDVDIHTLRIGYFTDVPQTTTQPEIKQGMLDLLDKLRADVACIEPVSLLNIEHIHQLQWETIFWQGNGAKGIRQALAELSDDQKTPLIKQFLAQADEARFDTAELIRRLTEIEKMQNSFHRLMQNYDLILCPVQATTALPHGEAHNHHDKFAFVRYFNVINNPVGTINIGFDQQGLPFGMQLAAKPFCEHHVFALGKYLQEQYCSVPDVAMP